MSTSATRNATTVAVLGIGVMGAPIARNLARQGFTVRAWNRTRAKADALAADGVAAFATPAETVSDARVVVTVLNDADGVLKAMEAAAPKLAAGTIWVQVSTVGVRGIARLAAFARTHDLVFYDAPVQGSRQPAENAQLVVLAAGPESDRAQVQPLFDAIGRRTLWVADDGSTGAGSRLKLALNHYAFTLTHAIAESLKLAGALGADPRDVIDVVSGGPMDNGYFQAKGALILNDDFRPAFTVANAVKDATLIAQAAHDAGMHADVANASLARFRRAVDAGHGDKDMAASFLA
ncbi:NAD(P)-dependent oxidoreductase [Burkholderia lata]|uniref:6-phosphogluconate dehydrogenase, NAD-binding protein n=1 Tax=Burkholderia lata (strain ATCC 17760 / DSM 23089 / LMG 22485 / NCIMB 9086 / R18194 / 383) TaxID=482957 RepID=Q392H4_BURL3|nr:NAD(P)-dependent oxidoreductase [Burkholderia lata]ABB12642.1 6-phosphogluconate dehydrogenase, NAD-binding protein [Burkholderia lata]